MSRDAPKILLVAGEASGDALGAGLARALRERLGAVRFVGVGGARMAAEGVESPFDIAQLSVLGFAEGIAAYRRVVARADETAALAARERPDATVLIDSWGFTLRVAHRLRRLDPDLPLIKYVGPQVWASRPGRARVLAKAVDHLLALHSFDAPLFERAGLATTVVGSPALARSFDGAEPARLRAALGMAADSPVLLVLPGSRPAEVARLGSVFGETVRRLRASHPGLEVVVPLASTVAEAVRAQVAAWGPTHLVEDEALKNDSFAAAAVALACSGTVTTELALAGAPAVVAYKLGSLTYALAKLIVTTPYASLLNIAAGAEVMPEFIQGRCEPGRLAAAVAARLDDPALRARQVAAQSAALDRMGRGGGDPSGRAADAVIGVLRARGRL